VVLVNSNPATIMTDPEFADATYVEPITPEFVEKIIAKERPDALLPTLGGQTALNTAVALAKAGVLEKYNVELIGADIEAIERGEDREKFKRIVEQIGAESARSVICHSMEDCLAGVETLGGYPVVVRPSFTMGGAGSGFAYDEADLRRIAGTGLQLSPTTEVLLEESILGWKEYELELMRDRKDNVVVVCSIENFDPMGVHTGDSITVAPLDDADRPRVPEAARHRHRHHPGRGRGHRRLQHPVRGEPGGRADHRHRDEPARLPLLGARLQGHRLPDREDRGAKLAVGYTLDEIPNDITGRPRRPSSRRSTTSW
jgi:carbamoyl-phosphate synthase large subunit